MKYGSPRAQRICKGASKIWKVAIEAICHGGLSSRTEAHSITFSVALIMASLFVGCSPNGLLTDIESRAAKVVPTPQFSQAAGTYFTGQSFSITGGGAGVTVYYTTDGTTPSAASTVYSSPFVLPTDSTKTVKAVAIESGMKDSAIASATYRIVRRISTVAGNGTQGYTTGGGSATAAELYYPVGLCIDSLQNLFIADSGNCIVRQVFYGQISTFAGINNTPGYTGDNGSATNAKLSSTFFGVTFGPSGNLYIADTNNNVLRKVLTTVGPYSRVPGNISTIAGSVTGAPGYTGDGLQASLATLNGPSGVVCDTAENIYISDSYNNVIRKIATSGVITTIAGNGTPGYGGDGGPAISAKLNFPFFIALDTAGSIYIADLTNNRIRKVSNAGIITTVAGNGTPGYAGDGGLATLAELHGPAGVAVDALGNLYISDTQNNVIRKVDSTGIITTIAGNSSPGYSGDGGPAPAAELKQPGGLTFDTSGNLYVGDYQNNVVRMLQ